jgi:hypothetical protein
MKTRQLILILSLFLSGATLASAQGDSASPPANQSPATSYQPKFPGDPARSDAEAGALGYMRVVLRAQNLYKKRHQHYASSLPDLAGTGSFTKRMSRSTERGDYMVQFHSKNKGESYTLAMIPKQYDDQHRAFYAEEDAVIHAEEGKPATKESAKIK